jgi:leucyl aminopeptidase
LIPKLEPCTFYRQFAAKLVEMKIAIERRPLEQIEADALVVPVLEGQKDGRFGAAALFESGEISGKALELTLIHHPPGVAAKRVLLAGGGRAEAFHSAQVRKLAGAALRYLKSRSLKNIAMVLEGGWATGELVSAAVEGAVLGDYEPDRYKSNGDHRSEVETFSVLAAQDGEDLDRAVERGRILAEAQNFTRTLVNEPANRLTPSKIAEAAGELARETGLEVEVLDEARMKEMGMGALLGVAQGSAEPPALIVLRYRPEHQAAEAHLGLVGKGVTFDTGGISIKPADGMEKMKYDMAGGGAMLGAMRALAQLKPSIAVSAFIPCVENMPGSRAQRPGDIVTAMSGKTVEVINTDAEGRLILADAISYARQQGCTHLVDAATLTGAIVVALGHYRVGLFSNDDSLRDRVLTASELEGERMWPMPLDEEYKDYLKSVFADLPNVGGRWGGSITAAMFLKEFAEDTPWVHLDIAGTAWLDDGKAYLAKGASGIPVRTLVRLAMTWKD